MDQNLKWTTEQRVGRAVDALRKNGMDAEFLPSANELIPKLDELMPPGCSCSVGGSRTLFETGVIDYLKSGRFTYHDRYAPGADVEAVFRAAAACDVYLASSNAVTERGELYNVDGHGNRVSAIACGPKKVILIAGYNKIVTDLNAAAERVRSVAAPANNVRLNTGNPCTKSGRCVDCSAPGRICCHTLVSGRQVNRGRITVLLLGEAYGY